MERDLVKKAKRIVIKIGTTVLTENDNTLSYSILKSIVKQVSASIDKEKEVIIVSSGAIALGLSRMGLQKRPNDIIILQAAASMGQSRLMHAYETEFHLSQREIAQILLTYEDIQNRRRYLNIRNTIFTLWSFGTVPIVNENDTVSFSEIRFGDNDLLAAYLANMIDADLFVILTDTEGLYDKNPLLNNDAAILKEIHRIDDKIKGIATGRGSQFSSGGMESKLKAAEIATKGGVGTVIASGRTINLEKLFNGEEIGTYFVPSKKKLRGKKRWIAFNPKIEGSIVIDKGGEYAIIHEKKSLLPAGVNKVEGSFEIGNNVSILNESYKEIARGLTNFSSVEIELIKGLNTKMIPEVLGVDTYFKEVVHRDNMVILV